MTISSKRAFPLFLCLALGTSASVVVPRDVCAQSASDLATARALYKEARELRDNGDAKGALDKFKAANALAGTPITALELGRTYAQLGQPLEARETWLSVARMKVQATESENAKSARTEAATLAEQVATRIPSLLIKIDGVPAGASLEVKVDGATVPTEALGLQRKLNPGEHVVVARAGSLPEEKRTVTLKEGESQTVTIAFGGGTAPVVVPPPEVVPTPEKKPEPAKEAPPATATQTKNKTNPIVYIGFGVGAAGLALGSVAGVVTFSKKSDITPLCAGLSCDASAKKLVTTARTWATVSTIGFIVGGVGVAAGVVGLLMPKKELVVAPGVTASLRLDPGSVGLEGTF